MLFLSSPIYVAMSTFIEAKKSAMKSLQLGDLINSFDNGKVT